ncbi:SDR family oxidoreductase|uniref:SDR family oxidoreductase n=1 Tax=Leuconostoc lactis TaxID=1246 RepID=A0A6L7A526_LEULA|nr:SDR family oxidoreductase [Leuconostoc lactis]
MHDKGPQRVSPLFVPELTPLGNDTETFLNGIFNEEIGIKLITKFDATETGITVAGQVDGFDPAKRVGKRDARKLDLFSQYAIEEETQAEILKNIPLSRFGEASEVAEAALFLAHSSYITGQTLTVDGGLYI